jgi:tripartite-type tricarboxylate transporter receptor subunit TctC
VGGGYDLYARLVARHLGKHIPGVPNVVPQNMIGAGGNTGAGFIFNTAPKDGTAIGAATAGVVSNGWPGAYKRLKIPVPIARNDTLEGVFGVAGGSALAFSGAGADGQPSLMWVVLTANVAGDVR